MRVVKALDEFATRRSQCTVFGVSGQKAVGAEATTPSKMSPPHSHKVTILPPPPPHSNSRFVLPAWLSSSQRAALLLTAFLASAGYAVIGLILLLLTVAAEGILVRSLPWRRSPVDGFTVAFVAAFLLSGWTSLYRPLAVGSAGLGALTIYLAFGPLYQQMYRDGWFLKTYLGVWTAGATLAAAWAFYLHLATGRPAFTPELTQNMLATTVLMGLIVSVGVFIMSRSLWRYAAAAGCVVLALALVETTSRGAWLGVSVALASFLILIGRRHLWQTTALLLFTGLVVLAVTTPERSRLLLRASSIPEVGTHDRVLLARTALAIFADHPVVGTGLNTFSLEHAKYKLPGDINVAPPFAHNVFLNMAAEGGALGFAAFSAIILWTLVAGWRWRATSSGQADRIASVTVLSAFLGLLVHQMFDGTVLSVHLGAGLWFLIAIVGAFQPDRHLVRRSVEPHGLGGPRGM